MINEKNLTESKEINNISSSDVSTKNIFDKMFIYVEIYNNNMDQSDILDEILKSHGANVQFLTKFKITN
jgi:hypothetical protein